MSCCEDVGGVEIVALAADLAVMLIRTDYFDILHNLVSTELESYPTSFLLFSINFSF
jgi:hypothetical protein